MFRVVFISVLASFSGLRFNESPVTGVEFVEESSGRRRRRRKSDDGAWDSGRANYIIKFGGAGPSTDAVKIKAFEAVMASVVAEAASERFDTYASLTNSKAEIASLVKANINVRPFAASSLLEVRAAFFFVLVTWDENSNWATNAPILPALLDQLFKVAEFRESLNTHLLTAFTADVADHSGAFAAYGITGFSDGDAVERTYSFTEVTGTVAVKLSYVNPPGEQYGIVTSTTIDNGSGNGAGAEAVLLVDLKRGLEKGAQVDSVYLSIASKIQAAKTRVYFFSMEMKATCNAGNLKKAQAVIGSKCERLAADKGLKAGFQNAAASTFGVSPSHLSIASVRCSDPGGDVLWKTPHTIFVDFKYAAPCTTAGDTEPKMINDRMNDCAGLACYSNTESDNDKKDNAAHADDGDDDGGAAKNAAADKALADTDIDLTQKKQVADTKAIFAKAKGTYTISGEVTEDGTVVTNTDITVTELTGVPKLDAKDGTTGAGTAEALTADGTVPVDVYLVKYAVAVRNDQNSQAGAIVGDVMKKHSAGIAEDEGWTDFKTGMTDSGQLKLRGIVVETCTAMADATLETKNNNKD